MNFVREREKEMKKKFQNWYGTHMDKWIPAYAFFSLIGCFVLNFLVYSITQHLGSNLYHYDFTTGFDRSVPFCPAWVSIYVLSFPFWVISYALTARENSKEFWYRFVFADMLARVVCGVFFLLIPTTNVRPEITGDGFWDNAMAFIYAMDMPYDLFPSIHCLASLMCYLGIRKCSTLPKTYRYGTLVFAILVFISTQFTKQHYIVDVIGGITVALGCFTLSMHCNAYKLPERLFAKIHMKVFGDYCNES